MTNNKQPWQQQDKESDLLYSYFNIYKDIPTHIRTVKKAHETITKDNKQITYDYMKQVAHHQHWQERIRAYDKHIQALVSSSKESSIKEMNGRHQDIGSKCIAIIDDQLSDPDILNSDPVKRPYLLQALIRGLEGAVRIERLALGESTSNTRQVNEGINNLMMVLTDSKKNLDKYNKSKDKANSNDVIDIEYTNKTNDPD